MSNDPRRVQAVFLAVVDQPVDDRPARLDQECGHDQWLRCRVEALLKAHDAPGSLVEALTPALQPANRWPDAEGIGAVLGTYKLLELLGEGGFGVVYMAEQTAPVRRKVALKIIKPGMDSRQIVARFEAERQALAMMDHPHIAKVLDAGATDAGRPYVVMELVHGVPITHYCDEQRLAPRERLRLFVDVCRAVQHAHQKGVIHRDLKPSNVLVTLHDDRAVAKVIDFGVAKAISEPLTEKTLFTGYGQMIGTPAYMSPEQAQLSGLDVDTRSDVYSLGVLLYELITGTTPFEEETLRRAGFDEMRRLIREVEPPRPSERVSTLADDLRTTVADRRRVDPRKLGDALRGELDWIVMKCLEKNRSRRYESANDLAADVERYLNGEAVEACPPTRGYQLRKLIRRHRAWIVTSALVAAALLLGLATTIWQSVAASRQRDAALRAGRSANEARVKAEHAVVDLYESRGMDHNDHGELAEAALWFANAAALCDPGDPARRDANLLRAATFRRTAPFPVRAFYQPPPLLIPNLQFDPSGRYLVCFNGDMGGLTRRPNAPPDFWKVWEIATEKPLTLPFAETDITSLAWSPDGHRIAIGSATAELLLADFPSLENRTSIPNARGARALAFSPDGKQLACGRKSEVGIWSIAAGTWQDPPLKHPLEIRHIAWSPDSSKLLTVCGFEARVFSNPCPSGDPLFPAVRHVSGNQILDRSAVWPLFADEGRLLVTVDTHVRWRDSATGDERGRSKIHNEMDSLEGRDEPVQEGLSAMAAGWDGESVKTAILSGRDAPIRSISFTQDADQNPQEMVFYHPSWGVTSLHHSREGFFLASGSEQGVVTLETNNDTRTIRHITSVTAIAFSPDSRLLATAQRDGLIRLWDLANAIVSAAPLPVSAPSLMAMSPDGQYVAPTGASFYSVRLRECTVYATMDGAPATRQPIVPGGDMVDAQFSADGNRLAIACRDPHTLTIWTWRDGSAAIPTIELPADPRGIDYGPDNLLAVLCGDATLLLVDGTTGAVQRQWKTTALGTTGQAVNNGRVQFSPDGYTLVSYGYLAEAWDVATGERRFGVQHDERCHDIAFSPDGSLLATADSDGTARLWNLNSGRPVTPDLRHPAWVYTVRFSADGKQLLTGCADGMVRLWDWRANRLAVAPMRHEGQVFSAEFMPDGRSIMAMSDDNRFCLWDRATGRPLTPRMMRYLNDAGLHVVSLTPDGARAVLAGFPNFQLLDLTTLRNHLGTPAEAIVRGELLSGRAIVSGNAVNLTSAEWLQRWRHFGQLPPLARGIVDEVLTTSKP